ncbi:MAG: hypothetical protein U9Q66_03765, partial [Patescibacteria group bacterium]|nr:hypothetical protein [Patescibacteria group bacterium]
QPKIVEEMKKIFLKPKASKEMEEKKKTPGKIKIGKLTSSKILFLSSIFLVLNSQIILNHAGFIQQKPNTDFSK